MRHSLGECAELAFGLRLTLLGGLQRHACLCQIGNGGVVAGAQRRVPGQLFGHIAHHAENRGCAAQHQAVGTDQTVAQRAARTPQLQGRGAQRLVVAHALHQVFQTDHVDVLLQVGQRPADQAGGLDAQQTEHGRVGIQHLQAARFDQQHRIGVLRKRVLQKFLGLPQGRFGHQAAPSFRCQPLAASPQAPCKGAQAQGRCRRHRPGPVLLDRLAAFGAQLAGHIAMAAQPARAQGFQLALGLQPVQARLQPCQQGILARSNGQRIGLQGQVEVAARDARCRTRSQQRFGVGPRQERQVGLSTGHGRQGLPGVGKSSGTARCSPVSQVASVARMASPSSTARRWPCKSCGPWASGLPRGR
jgi:hypothetical protein